MRKIIELSKSITWLFNCNSEDCCEQDSSTGDLVNYLINQRSCEMNKSINNTGQSITIINIASWLQRTNQSPHSFQPMLWASDISDSNQEAASVVTSSGSNHISTSHQHCSFISRIMDRCVINMNWPYYISSLMLQSEPATATHQQPSNQKFSYSIRVNCSSISQDRFHFHFLWVFVQAKLILS